MGLDSPASSIGDLNIVNEVHAACCQMIFMAYTVLKYLQLHETRTKLCCQYSDWS